jgi:hypothetical protein
MTNIIALLIVAVVLSAACSSYADDTSIADELPLLLEGGRLEARHRRRETVQSRLVRYVTLPSRGVWFIWLKVSNSGETPAVLTWDLDGEQPLHSSRARTLVQPQAKSQWVSYSSYESRTGFRMQVNVDRPGKHTLGLELLGGRALEIESIALTLYFNARPTEDGKTLDHTNDPGRGRASFPEAVKQVDGFRPDWQSPPIEAQGTTYFVDNEGGDDGNTGLSEEAAWRTLATVKATAFSPGDAILLKRGGVWYESLKPRGSGSKDAWITIGAYGEGPRPLVKGRGEHGLSLTGQSYWIIQDLQVTTNPDGHPGAGGIIIMSDDGPQPKGIRILNCVVFDTAGEGITVGTVGRDGKEGRGEGYDGVVIENCLTFAHDGAGIAVRGLSQNGCRNSVIRHCTAHSCDGMAGMWIHSGQNGLIEHCVAYNNAVYNIWTWNSINVTIRYCEVFRGRPPGAFWDSGGFDIDWGCEACTIEYCYAHHNKGAGVLLMGSGHDEYLGFPKETRYTLCRYNVFERNGHGILVFSTLEHGKIYNNVSISHHLQRPALELNGHGDRDPASRPTDNEFLNNILVGMEGGHPLGLDDAAISGGNVFDHNIYWRDDGKQSLIRLGGQSSDWNESTIAAWESVEGGTRPETILTGLAELRGKMGWEEHGLQEEPGLRAAGQGGNGRLPLEEYKLEPGSPAKGAGVRVALDEEWLAARRKYLTDTGAEEYGIPMEPGDADADYWGDKLHPDRVSIGAQR